MILCICLSPALDITYQLPRFEPGTTNRVAAVSERPGGKGLNVARILHRLGEPVQVLAPVGGQDGEAVAAGLRALGIDADLVPSGVDTRRTVAIVEDGGRTSLLSEPASLDCWADLVDRAAGAVPRFDVVVVSGSVPTGVPADGLALLVRMAREAGRPVIVDSSGPALASAVDAGPTVIKPNTDELTELTGITDPERAARQVAAASGATVIASLGPDGLLAVQGEVILRARPARVLTGNPTGAGDAVVAGLARGWRAGVALDAVLADCLALSAAAVRHPVAGEIDRQA